MAGRGWRRLALPLGGAALVVVAVVFWVSRESPAPPHSRAAVPETAAPETAAPETSPERPRRAHIAGRVLADERPVAGATVRSRLGLAVVTTDAEGRFDLGEPTYLAREVSAEAPGRRAVSVPIPKGAAMQFMEIRMLPCDAILSGIVRDVAGGAIARPSLLASLQGVPVAGAAIGDDTGVYSMCVPIGRLSVVAGAAGYAATFAAVDIDVAVAQRDFVLAPEAVIEGHVLDDAETSIPGAFVSAYMGSEVAVTDDSGRFRLVGVSPGPTFVSAKAPGYVGGAIGVVPSVDETTQVTLHLHRGRSVFGRVVSPDGHAGGIVVAVSGEAGGGESTTEEDGGFHVDGVSDGELELSVGFRGIAAQEPKVLPRTGDVTGIVLHLNPERSVAGHVLSRGSPVSGGTVELRQRRFFTTTTDGAGAFVFHDVGAEGLTLLATVDTRGSDPIALKLENGEARTGVDLELTLCGVISGVVVDASGGPVPGVRVHFEADHDSGEGTTDAHGRFRAGTLAGHRAYAATVTRPATGLPVAAAAAHPFPLVNVVDATTEVEDVRLVVDPSEGEIGGVVVDTAGSPVADATVGVARPGVTLENLRSNWPPLLTTNTPSDGRFVIRGLPVGSYTVVAQAPNGQIAAAEGVARGRSDIVLSLPPTAELVGTIAGFSGPVTVTVVDSSDTSWTPSVQDGRFVIEGLPGGTATVRAFRGVGDGYEVDTRLVELSPPARAEVALHRQPLFTMVGTFPEGGGGAHERGCVLAGDQGYSASVRIEMTGRFSLVAPTATTGKITCWRPGFRGSIAIPPAEPGKTVELVIPWTAR